jgi:hypothetical protein
MMVWGRALDWSYAHDLTTLLAGTALRARQRYGIRARQVHVDTTPFSVTGACEPDLDDLDDWMRRQLR